MASTKEELAADDIRGVAVRVMFQASNPLRDSDLLCESAKVLDAVTSQRDMLRKAVAKLEKALTTIMRNAPGYDWNADPLSLTRLSGEAFEAVTRSADSIAPN